MTELQKLQTTIESAWEQRAQINPKSVPVGLDAAIKGTQFKTTRDEVPIPGQVDASAKFTEAWLAAHPESAGPATIWGCLDDFTAGALSAIKQALPAAG